MAAVPLLLPDRPRILFVGINPGLGSARLGHNFAGPGNPFWRLLYASGLTPRQLQPDEEESLVDFGLGLVNLCDRPTRTAAELSRDELAEGRERLLARVKRKQPGVVALLGITMFSVVFPKAKSGGPGLKDETMYGSRVFVLPNPSGLNASYPSFVSKLVWFQALGGVVTTGGSD